MFEVLELPCMFCIDHLIDHHYYKVYRNVQDAQRLIIINKAYQILKNPWTRAKELLQNHAKLEQAIIGWAQDEQSINDGLCDSELLKQLYYMFEIGDINMQYKIYARFLLNHRCRVQ